MPAAPGDNLIEETNSTGAVVARYEQTQNIDEPLAMLRSSATSYFHADGLGSITSLSSAAGSIANTYTYDSYGNLTASSGSLTNSFRYTGREFDSETGLYYYRARYYDPSVGRFLNEDPIEFVGGIDFYRYAVNNPINLEDPTGFDPQSGASSCNPCANPPAPPGVNVAVNIVQTQIMNSMPRVGPQDPGILQSAFAAGWWFYMICCSSSPWNYKAQNPIYDDFGNYNFGATGAALGLPENLLLWGAGVKKYLQLLPHGGTGDPNDSNPLGRYPWGNQKHKSDCIKAGIQKYKNP